jgi:uncharacterized protein (TIGR02594 family)
MQSLKWFDRYYYNQNTIKEVPDPQTLEKPTTLPPWYIIAREEMQSGVKEIPGEKHNPRIVEYQKATSLEATDDETPWCSSFVNWCMMMTGIARTDKATARSWLSWGFELKYPKEGCVIIFSRGTGWQGHVGFHAGEKGNQILCLGGNQSDQVSISSYPKLKVLGYRWIDFE